jgi:hypothetical protein
MKRFLVTILSILYMASALSLTVHVHYCMGEFAGIRITDTEEGRCSMCGMEKSERSKGCCTDDQKTFKANEHQLAKASFDFCHHQIFQIVHAHYFEYAELFMSQRIVKKVRTHARPSVWRRCPLYVLNQAFLI